MGIIEGGSASGLLPNDRVFAVNFPGYPISLDRATQALGGEDRIAEVWFFMHFLVRYMRTFLRCSAFISFGPTHVTLFDNSGDMKFDSI